MVERKRKEQETGGGEGITATHFFLRVTVTVTRLTSHESHDSRRITIHDSRRVSLTRVGVGVTTSLTLLSNVRGGSTKINEIWVLCYDQFQKAPKALESRASVRMHGHHRHE
jgi:hypothetical protein